MDGKKTTIIYLEKLLNELYEIRDKENKDGYYNEELLQNIYSLHRTIRVVNKRDE